MQVCKCALRLALRRPLYFLIYGVGLSLMAVFTASSLATGAMSDEYVPYQAEFAVIDRDTSTISASVEDFLEGQGERVAVEDDVRAIQDAIAKGDVSYLLVIPEGYGSDLRRAAQTGQPLPEMECIYSYYSAEGALMDAALSEYASSLATYLRATPGVDDAEAVRLAREAVDADVEVRMIPSGDDAALTDQFTFFLQFDMYIYFAGVIVCVGLMLGSLNRTDVRRRDLASPVSYLSYTMQTGLACLVVMLVFWALTILLGVVCFPESFGAIPLPGKLLTATIPILFALIPLAIAFLLGQLNVGETAMNACGNILGLVLSFFGGAWIPLSLMSPEVLSVARLLPGYWYTDALSQAATFNGDGQALAAIGADMGILALFATALFAAGIVAGRMRRQTSEAGGNAAAEATA